MNLGDVLAENFKAKATLMRVKWGLRVTIVWLIMALIVLFGRIFVTYFILKHINAPKYVWLIFFGIIPIGLSIDHFEKVTQEGSK